LAANQGYVVASRDKCAPGGNAGYLKGCGRLFRAGLRVVPGPRRAVRLTCRNRHSGLRYLALATAHISRFPTS
jgi:hypothetical protein